MHHAAKWCEYLVSGVDPTQSQAIIYHMCDAKSWEEQIAAKGTYTPPTFEKDGFVHATVRAVVRPSVRYGCSHRSLFRC